MGAKLVLVKHAQPILDGTIPANRWRLGEEGEAQARLLSGRLAAFRPFALVSSREPKAIRTAEIVGAQLDLPFRSEPGFEEIDRPALKIFSHEEHQRLNRPLFEDPGKAVIGNESAHDALARFSAALQRELAQLEGGLNLVVVTHGTVISLLVAQHNSQVEAWDFWRILQCTSSVALRLPSLKLEAIEHRARNSS